MKLQLWKKFSTYIPFLVITAYWLMGIIDPSFLLLTSSETNPKYMDALYQSFFYTPILTLLVGPLYLLYVRKIEMYFNNFSVIYRFGVPEKVILYHGIYSVYAAVQYLGFIYCLIISGAFIYKQQDHIIWINYLGCFFVQTLTLLGFSLLFYIFILLTKNIGISFVCIYVFMIANFWLRMFTEFNIPFVEWFCIFQIDNSYFWICLSALLFDCSLLAINFILVNRHEWYKPKKV